MEKRGISAVVATVLIILITVAAITLIWTAIIPMIKNSLGKTECLSANFMIDTISGETCFDKEKGISVVAISRGASESNVKRIKVIFSGEGKSDFAIVQAPETNLGNVYYFNTEFTPNEISIAPIISTGNSESECTALVSIKPQECSIPEVPQEVLELNNTVTKKEIQLFNVFYGLKNADSTTLDQLASGFDLLVVDFTDYSAVPGIKSRNPKIPVLGYRSMISMHKIYSDWETANQNEDWFLHDSEGHRLISQYYGAYLMDVGNAGWQNHYADISKSDLDSHPEFDGVFADEVAPYLAKDAWLIEIKEQKTLGADNKIVLSYPIFVKPSTWDYPINVTLPSGGRNYYIPSSSTGAGFSGNTLNLGSNPGISPGTLVNITYGAVNLTRFKPTDAAFSSWYTNLAQMITVVKQKLGSKYLILNSKDTGEFLTNSDGILNEGFLHRMSQPDTLSESLAAWKGEINLFSRVPENKIFLVSSGTDGKTNDLAQRKKIMRYTFASYLLGKTSSSYFNFHGDGSSYNSVGYSYPDFEAKIGQPLGGYYTFSENSNYPQTNLLTNPSFESGLTGWSFYRLAGTGIISPDQDRVISKAGASSLNLSITNGEVTGGAYQYVTLKPYTDYTLTGWVKTSGIKSNYDIAASIMMQSETPAASDGVGPGDNDWTYLHTTLRTQDSTRLAYVYGGRVTGATGGTAWFDDIRLVEGKGYECQIYARNFTKALVMVNPLDSTCPINLGREYSTIEGDKVSQYTLSPFEGIILLK